MRDDTKINRLIESLANHHCTLDVYSNCVCLGFAKELKKILKEGETVSISKDSPLVKSFQESLNQPELMKGNKGDTEPF